MNIHFEWQQNPMLRVILNLSFMVVLIFGVGVLFMLSSAGIFSVFGIPPGLIGKHNLHHSERLEDDSKLMYSEKEQDKFSYNLIRPLEGYKPHTVQGLFHFPRPHKPPFKNRKLGEAFKYNRFVFIGAFVLLLTFFVFEESVAFRINKTDWTLKFSRLKKELEKAKLSSLKNQLNPHFLFNNLSTLSALIHENPRKANYFIGDLSKSLRYALENTENELVPLHKELAFIKAYIALNKQRFEDKLHIDLEIAQKLNNYLIPPLSLELLIGNAIKHNGISKDKPLCIKVYTKGESLVIENRINRIKGTTQSLGIGLKNLRKRFEILGLKVSENKLNKDIFQIGISLRPPTYDKYHHY